MSISAINIDLGDRSYDISIGSGLIDDVERVKTANVEGRMVFVVTDENVAQHYEERFEATLHAAGASRVFIQVIKPGERSKTFSQLEKTLNWMLDHLPDRNSVVVALGGGVVGDLAGFAASLLLRGVPYVQVPTSLLAQIDSSIGGKTAVDMPRGKNLIGRIYQPTAVFVDIETLKTLPERQLRSGYAEGVKHAVIKDREFFDWLQTNREAVLSLETNAMTEFLERNCRIKAGVVQDDENETGSRTLLNLGHTFGHALEAACGFDASLFHGEAISIGMVMAMTLSWRLGFCPEQDVVLVREHLEATGLPVSISQIDPPVTASAEALFDRMKGDKKAVSGKIKFVLARGIGKAFVTSDIESDCVKQLIQDSMNGHI